MAYAHQTPEEHATIEAWLDRNKARTSQFDRAQIETFLDQSIADEGWRHLSVSFAVCCKCESPMLTIHAIAEYGHIADILCRNCGYQQSLIMKTDMLV